MTSERATRATNDRRGKADANARDATAANTGRRPKGGGTTTTPSSGTTDDIPNGTGNGPGDGNNEPADQIPTSKPSGTRSNASNRRWRQPRNAREFAAQASMVATMVLNRTIDDDVARVYTAAARVSAQAMSTNATVARFLGTEADLSLDDDMTEFDDVGG